MPTAGQVCQELEIGTTKVNSYERRLLAGRFLMLRTGDRAELLAQARNRDFSMIERVRMENPNGEFLSERTPVPSHLWNEMAVR